MADFNDMSDTDILDFDEEWDFMQKGINKLIESLPNPHFTSEESMMLYTNVYNMSSAHDEEHPHGFSPQLYENYKKTFEDYIGLTVLPSLREKKDELLLKELLEQWSNYKIMTKYMLKFFSYLDIHYVPGRIGLHCLEETAFLSFYSLVYREMHRKVMDAILVMIARKRAGESIDENLINDALAFYSEIGEKSWKNEPKYFVETMMEENGIMQGASN